MQTLDIPRGPIKEGAYNFMTHTYTDSEGFYILEKLLRSTLESGSIDFLLARIARIN